jgi:hypothetical protein
MILLFGAAIVAHASLGGRDLPKRLALTLAAPSVVLLMLLPVILHTAHSPDSARAQELYATVRAPHHFQIARVAGDFAPVVGWLLAGLGGASLLREGHEHEVKRVLAFLGGIAVMVFGGATASVLFHSSAATQLFSWRIAPHASLLSQALLAAGLMRAAVSPGELSRIPAGAVLGIGAGTGVLCLHYGAKNEPNIPYSTLAFVGAAALATIVVYVGRGVLRMRPALGKKGALGVISGVAYVAGSAGPAAALLLTVAPTVRSLPEKSTIWKGINKDERELCAFMRDKTPKDALFVSPPAVETLRFHSQRAIIADWKSNPIVPGEMLEWYRRMGQLTGRPRFSGWSDLGGYEAMDAGRLAALRAEYHPDYVIIGRGRAQQLGCYATVFENARFSVVDLNQPCSTPPAPGAPSGAAPLRAPGPRPAPIPVPDERTLEPN